MLTRPDTLLIVPIDFAIGSRKGKREREQIEMKMVGIKTLFVER